MNFMILRKVPWVSAWRTKPKRRVAYVQSRGRDARSAEVAGDYRHLYLSINLLQSSLYGRLCALDAEEARAVSSPPKEHVIGMT